MTCFRLSRIRINIFLAFIIIASGCAPRYLEKTPATVLRYPYIPVNPQELEAFQAQLSRAPNRPEAAKSLFWIAYHAFNNSKWLEAEKNYLRVMQQHPKSEWAPVAGIMVARCRVKQEKHLDALAGLDRLRKKYQNLLSVIEAIDGLARKIINDQLTLADLSGLRAAYPDTAWAEQALFVLGKRNLDAGKPDVAIKSFEQFLQLYPISPFASTARDLMEKAVRIVPVNRHRIGCLLPLSGPYTPYGKTIQQGLQLALEHINLQRGIEERLSLAFMDTAGTDQSTVAGFLQLVEKEKVMLILGPALSNSVKALIPEIRRRRISVITTSASEPGLPQASPNLFRYMLTNQEQGSAMAEYVVLRKHHQRIGILNSETVYDRSLAEAFDAKVIQLGGEVVAHLEYPPGATDFRNQMLALGGVDPGHLKDLKVRERKAMERVVERVAHLFHRALIPAPAGEVTPTPEAIPDIRIAIVRLTEEGDRAQREKIGKLFTEKISYALAPRDGVEVLTQAETFKALRQLGLSTLELTETTQRKLAQALHVDYLILGKVTQKEEESVQVPGEPLPVHYKIEVELVHGLSAKPVKKTERKWTESISPEKNVKDIDAIYLPVSARDAVLIASQLAFYDLKPAIFGCDAWMTPKLLKQAGSELEGAVLATGFWPHDPSPQSREFVGRFETEFKTQPTLLAVQAYDALQLVAGALHSLENTKAGRGDFQKALLSTREFQGVTGKATVDKDGEIKREAVFLEISHKKIKRVH